MPVGERSELTGIESRDVLKYVSSKKAPDDAASAGKAGFDG